VKSATPAQIAALRCAVAVNDDERPGTLTALLARLERFWRESEAARAQALQAQPHLRERRAW
jgi:hypothetical protein